MARVHARPGFIGIQRNVRARAVLFMVMMSTARAIGGLIMVMVIASAMAVPAVFAMLGDDLIQAVTATQTKRGSARPHAGRGISDQKQKRERSGEDTVHEKHGESQRQMQNSAVNQGSNIKRNFRDLILAPMHRIGRGRFFTILDMHRAWHP